MFDYAMEHVFSYNVLLNPNMEVIGPTPQGLRVNLYIQEGQVSGEKVNGKIRPVGADWLTVRQDGIGIMDVRATIETDDGALIFVEYSGVIDFGEDGYTHFLSGKVAERIQIRAVPRYTTAHPDYLWLNRLQCVNIGEGFLSPDKVEVSYDVYALK